MAEQDEAGPTCPILRNSLALCDPAFNSSNTHEASVALRTRTDWRAEEVLAWRQGRTGGSWQGNQVKRASKADHRGSFARCSSPEVLHRHWPDLISRHECVPGGVRWESAGYTYSSRVIPSRAGLYLSCGVDGWQSVHGWDGSWVAGLDWSGRRKTSYYSWCPGYIMLIWPRRSL